MDDKIGQNMKGQIRGVAGLTANFWKHGEFIWANDPNHDFLTSLVWVLTVCKSHQQTILADKKLEDFQTAARAESQWGLIYWYTGLGEQKFSV